MASFSSVGPFENMYPKRVSRVKTVNFGLMTVGICEGLTLFVYTILCLPITLLFFEHKDAFTSLT